MVTRLTLLRLRAIHNPLAGRYICVTPFPRLQTKILPPLRSIHSFNGPSPLRPSGDTTRITSKALQMISQPFKDLSQDFREFAGKAWKFTKHPNSETMRVLREKHTPPTQDAKDLKKGQGILLVSQSSVFRFFVLFSHVL